MATAKNNSALSDAVNNKLTAHFNRIFSNESGAFRPADQQEMYDIDTSFHEKDLYWRRYIQAGRFDVSLVQGCLYRPDIVNELVAKVEGCLSMKAKKGLMIKGPQGIGKSHSIVNLVRKFVYNEKYLVTFVPDCQMWKDLNDLMKAIAASFGSADHVADFGLDDKVGNDDYVLDQLELFVKTISKWLTAHGKQWVFVYDQINKLFARPMHINSNSVGNLTLPFKLISDLMKAGRITSVISASANNEASYKESHPDFVDYNHTTCLTNDEIHLCFFSSNEKPDDVEFTMAVDATGGVPLLLDKLAKLVREKKFNYEAFTVEVAGSIEENLFKLEESFNRRHSQGWNRVTTSAVACVLGTHCNSIVYDKKFSIKGDKAGYYIPLFPLVTQVYQDQFWDDLMATIQEKEAAFLEVCKDPETTNDTRGRLFELIVIHRCSLHGFLPPTVGESSVSKSIETIRFPGNTLPSVEQMQKDGLYVPINCNFPAIDFIWKQGKKVWAVQVHVNSNHDDISDAFKKLYEKAKWFDYFDEINLWYLCPNQTVANAFKRKISFEEPSTEPTGAASGRPKRGENSPPKRQKVLVQTLEEVKCLQDIPWPQCK